MKRSIRNAGKRTQAAKRKPRAGTGGPALNARDRSSAEEGPANRGVGPKREGAPGGGRGAIHSRSPSELNESIPAFVQPPLEGDVLPPTYGESPAQSVLEDVRRLESLDANVPRLADTKGSSLKNVGFDSLGRVIPHKYSGKVASIVAAHVVAGTDESTICILLNMRPGKLRELYHKELDTAIAQTNADVGRAIVAQAKKGHPVLARFYAKAKMGWKDGEQSSIPVSPLNIHIHQ